MSDGSTRLEPLVIDRISERTFARILFENARRLFENARRLSRPAQPSTTGLIAPPVAPRYPRSASSYTRVIADRSKASITPLTKCTRRSSAAQWRRLDGSSRSCLHLRTTGLGYATPLFPLHHRHR